MHAGARDRCFEQPSLYGIVVDNQNGLRQVRPQKTSRAMIA
jgi:hypothetical protein